MSDIRVRFAPSPTGYLHIGGLRTALYVYLFARKHGGSLVLRIEDTDRTRFVEDAEDDILTGMKWAGIDHDEGPDNGGDFGPYRQSERTEFYDRYANQLLDDGKAYYAFDTSEELAEMREKTGSGYNGETRMSMRNSLTLSAEDVESMLADESIDRVIRLKVPADESITFNDVCRGDITFSSSEVDDQVLIKSDGLPTYHLANVVDDHLMKISHVIRGEDWLSSTPKHVLLYRALGWDLPVFAHLPLILSPSGGKLSKRKAEKDAIHVFVSEYREAGFEPEAVINFLALLGWNPGTDQEIFTIGELIDQFSLDRVGSSGVQFDSDKLQWMNEQVLHAKSPQDILDRVDGFYPDADTDYKLKIIGLLTPRLKRINDLADEAAYFFSDPKLYDESVVSKRWKPDSGTLVNAYRDRIEEIDPFRSDDLHTAMKELAKEKELGFGKVILPVRLALTGQGSGPGVFDVMELLGRETCLRRMDKIVETLT